MACLLYQWVSYTHTCIMIRIINGFYIRCCGKYHWARCVSSCWHSIPDALSPSWKSRVLVSAYSINQCSSHFLWKGINCYIFQSINTDSPGSKKCRNDFRRALFKIIGAHCGQIVKWSKMLHAITLFCRMGNISIFIADVNVSVQKFSKHLDLYRYFYPRI